MFGTVLRIIVPWYLHLVARHDQVNFCPYISNLCSILPGMCVHGNALTDDCLLAIFDRISLAQLLRFDQICHRWAALLTCACARRRTLTLVLGRSLACWTIQPFNDHLGIPIDGLPVAEREAAIALQYLKPKSSNNWFDGFMDGNHAESKEFFDILYRQDGPDFTEMSRFRDARHAGQVVTYLTDLFSNVHTLVVIHSDCYEGELLLLAGLLRSKSWSLVTLELWLQTRDIDERYLDRPDQHPVGTLLQSINQCSSLQHLTLAIGGDGFGHEFTFPEESFAFIAQLKVAKIYLHCYDLHNRIWNVVHRFDSAQLGEIAIGTVHTLQAALNPPFKHVATKVRQLYHYHWFGTVELLSQVCLRFTSLTMFELYWSPWDITFTELVTHLASLRQLAHLKMRFYFQNPHFQEDPFAVVDRVDGEADEPRHISLPQVKILQFTIIRKRDHHDFESFSARIFPSVEMVILKNLYLKDVPMDECDICQPNINGQHDHQVAKRCNQLMALSLRNKFTNPAVQMVADGVIINLEPDNSRETFKTVVILVAVFIGLPFLFRRMKPN